MESVTLFGMGGPSADGRQAEPRPARRTVAWPGPPLFYVLATVLMTWPLARDIGIAIRDHGLFGAWRMAWVAHGGTRRFRLTPAAALPEGER